MDDDFLTKLKSISVKDVLTDQRPATSRLRSSRGGRSAFAALPAETAKPNQIKSIDESAEESRPMLTIAELLSKQPDEGSQQFPSGDESTVFKLSKPKNDGEMGNFSRSPRIGSAVPSSAVGNRSLKSTTVTSIQGESSAHYIPDLNEIQAEEIIQAVASAPEMQAEKITSLRELDADLARLHTFSVARGVDMRKLARFMLPEQKLVLYSDQDEDMRSITYEQLYSDLLPLINGKNLIAFDFTSLKGQRSTFDGFPFLTESGMLSGFAQKDGKMKKKIDPQLLQKLKDYATASVEKFDRKQEGGGTSLAYLEEILRKAKDKYEQKERVAAEKKGKGGTNF